MKNSLTYTMTKNGYYIPNITVPKCKPIGKYGMFYRRYIKQHRCAFYSTLLMSGHLNDHLYDIDRQALQLRETLLPQYMALYGITEQLKADNQMEWVRLMNMINHQIDEVIFHEVII